MEETTQLRDWAGRILSLSQRLLELARQEQWQQMVQIETERRALIDGLFRHPGMPAGLAHVADLLESVVELDGESIALGMQARQQMSRELDVMLEGRSDSVIRAYNSFTH